jgi:hypothetical protein
MFVTNPTVASVVALLAVGSVCGTNEAHAAAPPAIARDATKPPLALPNGNVHDFGKLLRGARAEHVFRIVNTSGAPLEITSVKRGGGCAGAAVSGRVTRRVLQPNEETQLKVSLDTTRFVGPKTLRVLVETDGGTPMVTVFWLTADAQNPPQP